MKKKKKFALLVDLYFLLQYKSSYDQDKMLFVLTHRENVT